MMQPYRPAPAAPGPGALIGGIIAIVAAGAGLALAAGFILAAANASYVLFAWTTRAVAAVTLVAVVPYVLRWVRLRRPDAVRREIPALVIFGAAAAAMCAVVAAAWIARWR
ncbi:MAG TPA: hypothetical protein VK599_07100 [Streptosporangiaceae bacterium]|nr:hypothetical protein [Streptosporangiaceae bacterium]